MWYTQLWFDVEKKNYTTNPPKGGYSPPLWFDVEKKNYTTIEDALKEAQELWFDVEKKNYTTIHGRQQYRIGCGLM